MQTGNVSRADDLHEIINQKITALIRELEDAGWNAYEVAAAIDHIITKQWLARAQALQDARNAIPDNFVSDGNEG